MRKRYIVVSVVIILIPVLVAFSGCTSPGAPTNDDNQNEPATDIGTDDSETEPDDTNTDSKDTTSESIEWLTFDNEEHHFSIDYPSNWIIVDSGGRYGVVFRPYEGTQTTFYVDTKKSQFADWTYDDYVGDMLDQLQRVRKNATFGDAYNLEIHGHPFTVIDYEEEGADGETYYYRSYFTAHGYGYIVYYVIQGDEYDEYAEIAEQIAESFKFTK